MKTSNFLSIPHLSSPSLLKVNASKFAKPSLSSSSSTKIQALPFLSSSSLPPIRSVSSSLLLPIKCSKNDDIETREKAEIGKLRKKIHNLILEGNMVKATSTFDDWKSKRDPLFEDGKTSRQIVRMSRGEFVIYVWEKFFGPPSERKKKD